MMTDEDIEDRPARLLLIEDADDDADLIVFRLKKAGIRFTIERVETEAEFRRALTQPIDLIISDFTLPQFGATFALGILKSLQRNIPLIIISGAIGEETAVAAMKHGAIDYVLKDRLARLPQAVVHGIEIARMREAQRKTQQDLIQVNADLARMSVQLIEAQEQERKSLARELHDELGQRLSALNIGLHRLRGDLASPEAQDAWGLVEAEVSGLIAQVRTLSGNLRPQALDYLGLEAALQHLLERRRSSRCCSAASSPR